MRIGIQDVEDCFVYGADSGLSKNQKALHFGHDASNREIGAMLTQIEDGEKRVIEYYSKVL